MILPSHVKPAATFPFLNRTPEERAKRRAALAALLDRFMQGDAQEQRETGEYLMKVLDEDRTSYRKLFPK